MKLYSSILVAFTLVATWFCSSNGALLKLNRCSQSGVAAGGVCRRAIDGNTNQQWRAASCMHTPKMNRPWWQAHTNHLSYIQKVRIYNRMDCCSNRLRKFVIQVDGKECARYISTVGRSSWTYGCGKVGRVVRLQVLDRTHLNMCEVQVFGWRVKSKPKRKRSALLKLNRCSQSGVAAGGVCRRAIDGNTNQQWRAASCMHTPKMNRPWWQAHTNHLSYIQKVRIYNRMDCCSNRLRKFVIQVDGKECARYISTVGRSSWTYGCGKVGRVVRLQVLDRTHLNMCEVQVFGWRVKSKPKRKTGGRSGSSGGWRTEVQQVGQCVDPYTNKSYKKGATWVSKSDGMCHHYRCTLDARSSKPTRSDCIDARGRCVRATRSGAEFKCKFHGKVSDCSCQLQRNGEVLISRSEVVEV